MDDPNKIIPAPTSRLNPIHRQPKFMMKWVNGEPIPYTEWRLPKNQIENTFLAALALPYEGRPDPLNPNEKLLEPELDGLTNVEVMAINLAKKAANGEIEAIRAITDRVLGKPKQAVENTNVNISLAEYLQSMDLEAKSTEWDAKVVNVESSPVEEARKPSSPKQAWTDDI